MALAAVVLALEAELAARVLENGGVGRALVVLGAVGRQDFAAAGSQWAVRGAAGAPSPRSFGACRTGGENCFYFLCSRIYFFFFSFFNFRFSF